MAQYCKLWKPTPQEASFTLGSPKNQAVPSSDSESQRLTLPECYSDRDFGKLLNRVITSPKLLTSNPMVNVLITTPTTFGTPNPPRASTDSQMGSASEDFGASNEASVSRGGEPLVEKAPESIASTYFNTDSINDSQPDLSPPESEVEDQTEDIEVEMQTNLAITEYEIVEDEQIRKLTSMVTPLTLVIGTNHHEICIACFHMGHHHTDFDSCPAARINSLFSEKNETSYDRSLDKAQAHKLLMRDIAWCCQGLSWAIQYVCKGHLGEFQIYPSTVARLRALLGRWKSVCHDEKFTFGKFGECGGELIFGEPIQVPLVENDGGPFQQVVLRDGIPILEAPGGKNVEATNKFVNSFVDSKFRNPSVQPVKQRAESDADRLQLDVIGNRPAAVCTNCLYRGHAKNSVKICPYLIVSLALDKLNKGRIRAGNVTKELECLENVVKKMTGPKVQPIESLIAQWKDAVANNSKSKKSRAAPPSPLQLRAIDTPVSFESHRPPIIPPNDPLQPLQFGEQPESSSYLSLAPFYSRDSGLKSSNSLRGFSEASLSALNSPFDENGASAFFNTPLENECFASPPPQKSTQYHSDPQHRIAGSTQGADYSFSELEAEFGDGKLVDQEEMQALFGEDFNTPMLNISQSLTTNDPHPPSQNGNNHFGFQNFSEKELTNYINPETDRPTQPTNVSIPSSQQSNSLAYESNPPDLENNLVGDELPVEMFWRARCPLKIIGNRGDSFCKACLHYGHDKRSQSCLVNIIRIAITTNRLHAILAVNETIKDLEAGSRWQKNLPEAMQTKDGTIVNLIRRWKEAVENLRKEAEEEAEIYAAFPSSKRRRSPEGCVPAHQQQVLQRAPTTAQYQTQIGYEMEYYAPNVTRSPEGQLSQTHQSQPPRRIALGNHQMQNRIHSPALSQNSSLPSSSSPQQTFSQKSPRDQSSYHQADVVAPKGWAIDYSRMDSSLFAQISDYIITDGDSADRDKLRVNNRKMPPMLVIAIRKYVLPEDNVQQALIPQPVARQPHHPPPAAQLPDIGQRYRSRMQTPKRKRN